MLLIYDYCYLLPYLAYGSSEYRTLCPKIGQLIIFLPMIQKPFWGIPLYHVIPHFQSYPSILPNFWNQEIPFVGQFKHVRSPKCRLVDMHLAGRGDRQAKRVMFGRSIGATCAVHLAKSHTVHGLIVDSGLMSIKQLPTVQMPPGHTGENQRLVVNPQQILNIQNNF